MDVEMYPNPEFGKEKSVYLADPLVAMLPGVRGAVAQAAADGAAVATTILNGHRRWGHGNSRIVILPAGGPDILVALEDPGPESDGGGMKALAIEGETNALSSAFGTPKVSKPDVKRDPRTGRFVRQYWARDGGGRFTGGGG